MKKLLFLVLLFPAIIFAQNEFGYHATWHFSYEISEPGTYTFGYKKVNHVGDTSMLGMSWLKFDVVGMKAVKSIGSNTVLVDSNFVFAPVYLATHNDSVFRLLNDSTAYLLFDFNANVGGSWQFADLDTNSGCDSLPIARVVDKGSVSIDNQMVNYLDLAMPVNGGNLVTSEYMGLTVYPDFGSLGYSELFQPSKNFCDGRKASFIYSKLTCFSNDFMAIQFYSQPCDDVPFFSRQEYQIVNFEVYPNPTNGLVNIQAEQKVTKVEVYSLNGQKLIETTQTENIELPASSGMYVVAIYFEDGQKVLAKVVRE